jgi:signal transduction histidine kinase
VPTLPAPRPAPGSPPGDLAGALHDGPVQSLLAALYGLQLADGATPGSPAAAAAVATVRDAVVQALAELRRTMTSLRNPLLDDGAARSGDAAAHPRLEAET